MVGPGRLFHFYSVQGDGSKIPGGPSKEISGEYFPGANAPSQVSKGGCRQCGTLSQMGNVARSGNVSHLGKQFAGLLLQSAAWLGNSFPNGKQNIKLYQRKKRYGRFQFFLDIQIQHKKNTNSP